MHFERLSENQFRCTLTQQDLDERNLNIKKLTYRSSETETLFQELMEDLSRQYHFRVDNEPLMIEAIPLPNGQLMLLITRVAEPEELDLRFSRFTPEGDGDGDPDFPFSEPVQPAPRVDDIIKLIQSKASAEAHAASDASDAAEALPADTTIALSLSFAFSDLDHASDAACAIASSYSGANTLYKDEKTGTYYLYLSMSDCSPAVFNAISNRLAEYGNSTAPGSISQAYLEEHGTCIIRDRAVQILSSL